MTTEQLPSVTLMHWKQWQLIQLTHNKKIQQRDISLLTSKLMWPLGNLQHTQAIHQN